MLFILKANLGLLGNVGYLVFNRTILPKTCPLWSDDDLLHVSYQASVDQSFHEFAHTTGEAELDDICLYLLDPCLSFGWVSCQLLASSEEHALYSSCWWTFPEIWTVLVPRSSISLIILLGPGNVFQDFQGFFKLLCVKQAVQVLRLVVVSLVVLDFIMHLLLPAVWKWYCWLTLHRLWSNLLLSCQCLLVSPNHDRLWSSLLIIHGLGQFPNFVCHLCPNSTFQIFSLQLVLAACMWPFRYLAVQTVWAMLFRGAGLFSTICLALVT